MLLTLLGSKMVSERNRLAVRLPASISIKSPSSKGTPAIVTGPSVEI